MHDTADTPLTGPRARTRRAILDAAVSVLARDIAAPLADIAAAAGVGRTTLHRYYPERSHLFKAVAQDSVHRIDAVMDRVVRGAEGPAVDTLRRLCQELFELGDALALLFTEPQVMAVADWGDEDDVDLGIERLVERGHAEGTIDPAMSGDWVQNVLWSLLYIACERVRAGGTKHEALSLCLRTFDKAIAPPG